MRRQDGARVRRDGALRRLRVQGESVRVDASLTERMLERAIVHIARSVGDDISPEKPLLDARLPDGSRVAAVFPPCSLQGASMAIRKFQSKVYTAEQLIHVGALTKEVMTL